MVQSNLRPLPYRILTILTNHKNIEEFLSNLVVYFTAIGHLVNEVALQWRYTRFSQVAEEHVQCDEVLHVRNVWTTPCQRCYAVCCFLRVRGKVDCLRYMSREWLNWSRERSLI